MRRKILRATTFSMVLVIVAALLLVGAFYMRLSYGPVSLNFMTGTIQNQINKNLSGMTVSVDGVLIERQTETGIPHFRLRNIILKDADGQMIARAPRAAVGVEEGALFSGHVVPRSLELIGPQILIKRNLQGAIELGFGADSAASEDSSVPGQEQPSPQSVTEGKTDQQGASGFDMGVSGAILIKVLAGDESQAPSTLSSIEDIRVSDASIRVFDEANNSVWEAPNARMAFSRTSYGFAVVANTAIANGQEEGYWHAEISASYRRDSRTFAITSRITDLVPANIADQIYALSQLARVKVPLSGQADVLVSDTGEVLRASAEFNAAAGEVSFPDYFANPIIIDEGSLRANFDPATGGIEITDSTLLVGSSRAELAGKLTPVRDAAGRLLALDIDLKSQNVALDPQGTIKSAIAVDRVNFKGKAAVTEARLDIEDLVVLSGESGVRMRGTIAAGEKSPRLLLSGRLRSISIPLLKQLWPPVVAPRTRTWVSRNVSEGTITDGEFTVDLPANAMAKAVAAGALPPNSIRLSVGLDNVTSGYFKDLPPVVGGRGQALLQDNVFTLTVDQGQVTMPSGKVAKLNAMEMTASNILTKEALGSFVIKADAPVPAFIELLDLPDLNLLTHAGVDTSKLGGNASATVTLDFPFLAKVPPERLIVTAKAKLNDASLTDALPKIDVTGGKIDLAFADGKLSADGTAKFNGVEAAVEWQRAEGKQAKQSAVLEATLDEGERKKLGINLGTFLEGPVHVKATIPDLGDPQGRMDVDADLSKSTIRLDAIRWKRPPTKGTKAEFAFYTKGDKGKRIDDLKLSGSGGLLVTGQATLADEGGLAAADFDKFQLSDKSRLALKIRTDKGRLVFTVNGDSFDARPMLDAMFKPRPDGGDAEKLLDAPQVEATVTANVDRVYAQRGEIITGVSAKIDAVGNSILEAEISGNFLSGQPLVIRVTQVPGGKELRIICRDGGAALRAADFYSKVAGGQMEFYALMTRDSNSNVRKGELTLRNFEVRNEAALAELDEKGKPLKTGPRREGYAFRKLKLPFTTDAKFVRIGDALVRGDELGAAAEGLIRKSDGAIDITGTIIPAYALNSVFSDIPLVGDILSGGKGQGVIGLTFALGGTMAKPVFQVNPVSVIAPGILRKFFEYGNTGGNSPTANTNNADKVEN